MGSRALSIINRADRALRSVGPQDRTAYYRITTVTGGDQLIGRPGSVSFVDTVFDPQPLYTRLGRFDVGPTTKEEAVNDPTGQFSIANEYQFTFTSTALPTTLVNREDIQLVLKDAAGVAETFTITDYAPVAFQGVIILYNVFAKSNKRP